MHSVEAENSGIAEHHAYLLGILPPSVIASHHRLKPTLTIVLDRNTANTTSVLMSRFRKALKIELFK